MSGPFNYYSDEWIATFNKTVIAIQESIRELCSETCPPEKIPVLRGKISALKSVIEHDKDRCAKISINPFY
jgi:hypothetical protein